MTRSIRVISSVVCGAAAALAWAALGGCASTPAVPAASAPPASASAAPAGKPVINGYRRQVRAGQELYCRDEGKLGTRVKGREACYTAFELAERQKAADELLRNARGAVGESAAPRMDSPAGP